MRNDSEFKGFSKESKVMLFNKREDESSNFYFELEREELRKLDVKHLPCDVTIIPIINDDYVGSGTARYCLKNEKGLGLVVEYIVLELNDFWANELCSLECYIKNMFMEIKEYGNLSVVDINTQHPEYMYVVFESELEDVTSLEKAFNIIDATIKDLEERVMRGIAKKRFFK